jgi:hypothetical protein
MTSILDRPLKARRFTGVSLRRRTSDVIATVLVTLSVVVALVPLIWVLYSVIAKGLDTVKSTVWWTHSQADMTAFMSGGGAYHAIVGTVLQGLVCAAISIPIGVFVAIYLVEYGGDSRLSRVTSFMVDVLTGVPSIVAALFIYALFIATFGFPRCGFAVSLALVLLMIPVIVRTTEEMLLIVPADDHQDRTSGRHVRHYHRHPARAGPCDGRDGAAADAGRLLAGDEFQHLRRFHGLAARHDVRPDVGRGRHQCDSYQSAVGRRPDADCRNCRH